MNGVMGKRMDEGKAMSPCLSLLLSDRLGRPPLAGF